MSTASEVLRDRIKSSGLTQKEIQDGSGVSQGTISSFMRGNSSMSLKNAEKILAFLVNVKITPRTVSVRRSKAAKVEG